VRPPPGLRPLRHRDFALYWTGLSVSQVGDWMETTTTAWLLYEITRSPVLLGVGGGIRALVVIVFGLVGGALADRVPRVRVLFITQSAFAVSSLVLGTLVVSGQVTFWHIYAFAAVNGTLSAFDAPARRALFPTLVPRSEMQNAITLNGSVFRLAKLVGPAVAGVVIATYGPAVSYFVNSASYAAILVALALMRAHDVVPRPRAPLLGEALGGLRYTLDHSLLRSVVILESIHSFFGVNTALLTILASDVFHVGPAGLGLLLSAQALGALGGTGLLVTLGDIERKGRSMIVAGTVYVVSFGGLAFMTAIQPAALLVAATGATDTIWATMRNTIFQLRTDDAYRGRTMGVLLLAGRGFAQGSQLETGLAVSAGGPGLGVLLSAAAVAVGLIVVNVATEEVRSFRGSPEPLIAAVAASPDPGAD
jgi:MFS family permease